MSAANIDVITESALWDALPDAEQIVRNAVTQAAAALDRQADAELAVLLTDDAAIQRLNATWRGLDKPTNVLSFPSAVTPESQHLGDIAVAFETTAREAGQQDKPLAHHLAHLSVHGFLHLVGYDHESETEAETMEELERVILARIGVPDPYRVQSVEETGV
jgi:probable rRNA maturation factor